MESDGSKKGIMGYVWSFSMVKCDLPVWRMQPHVPIERSTLSKRLATARMRAFERFFSRVGSDMLCQSPVCLECHVACGASV